MAVVAMMLVVFHTCSKVKILKEYLKVSIVFANTFVQSVSADSSAGQRDPVLHGLLLSLGLLLGRLFLHKENFKNVKMS